MPDICYSCAGIKLPDERLGERHASVRFGDVGGVYDVYLNGANVSERAYEAFAGTWGFGWVLLYDFSRHHPYICERCGDVLLRYYIGEVRLERAA